MSRHYESLVTITIADEERDVRVSCHVSVGHEFGIGGGVGAELDGDPRVERTPGTWVDANDLSLSRGDLTLIEETLCDVALEDDRDACVEWERAS